MDRRYSQSRFYDGTPAVPAQERSEALVRRYLGAARQQAQADASYGGSTGGVKSLAQPTGLLVLQQRAQEAKDRGLIFKAQGSGRFGARAAAWEARQLPELA